MIQAYMTYSLIFGNYVIIEPKHEPINKPRITNFRMSAQMRFIDGATENGDVIFTLKRNLPVNLTLLDLERCNCRIDIYAAAR